MSSKAENTSPSATAAGDGSLSSVSPPSSPQSSATQSSATRSADHRPSISAVCPTKDASDTVGQTITAWIERLKAGDPQSAEQIWKTFFQKTVELARRKLMGAKRTVSDEEDVALSAFKSLCVGAQQGRFPRLNDRDSLWSLLVAITAHKSVDLIRRENRQKRGGGVEHEPAMLSRLVAEEPNPESVAALTEEFNLLLSRLSDANDGELVSIVVAKMQGDSNREIADRLGCVPKSIERRLRLVRRKWEREFQ